MRTRPVDGIPLNEIDAQLAQQLQRPLVFYPLGDGAEPRFVRDPVDGCDDLLIDLAVGQAQHEAAVDLDEVGAQVFQVGEAAHAAAEVVERHAGPQ